MEFKSDEPKTKYVAMDFGTILASALRYWIKNIRSFWPLYFTYQLAITGILYLILFSSGFDLLVRSTISILFVSTPLPFYYIVYIPSIVTYVLIAILVILFIINFIIPFLLNGMVIQHTADYHAGLFPSLGSSYAQSRRRIWSLIGSQILLALLLGGLVLGGVSLLILGLVGIFFLTFWMPFNPFLLLGLLIGAFVGFALLIVAMVYLATRFTVTAPAIILEEAGAVHSLSMSWGLVRGNWWRTFGITFIVSLLSMSIAMPVSLISSFLILFWMGPPPWFYMALYIIVSAVIIGFTAPLNGSTVTMLYHDLMGRQYRA